MTTTADATPASPAAAPRLMSLDALRGFDMFWILGADALVNALHRMTPSKPVTFLADQLEHVDWEGFRFYDLIFPLFVFMVGVSLVFSLTKTIAQAGRAEALQRVFRRGILLFVIGIFYSGGFSNPWPDIRLLGVLNRLALAYLFTGLLFCFFKPRALVAICVGLLLGYWGIMTWTPIRDIQLENGHLAQRAEAANDPQTAALFRSARNPSAIKDSPAWVAAEKMFYATTNRVTGKFEMGLNVANHFDFEHLPGKKWDGYWDPEGLLSTIPAVATCLLGVFAGLLLVNPGVSDSRKIAWLFGLGAAGVALGFLWGQQFPVIKKLWTSSYVLVAGGYSAMLLGAFYLVVDVWQQRQWCQPFVWIGMNSITIYLAANILGDFHGLSRRLVGGDIHSFLDAHMAKGFGDLLITTVGLLMAFWLVHFLYKRKIFLRL